MNYLRESDQYATLKLFYPPNWMNCQFALRFFMEGQKSVTTMVQYFCKAPPRWPSWSCCTCLRPSWTFTPTGS
jgi:hypothetical protein